MLVVPSEIVFINKQINKANKQFTNHIKQSTKKLLFLLKKVKTIKS